MELRNDKNVIKVKNVNLLTRDGTYNLMAGILADVNSYSMKVAVFRGTNKTKGMDGSFIVKDYVKSRKHEWYDACFIKNIRDTENASKIITKDEYSRVESIAQRIKSNFVTVDLARKEDGSLIIMEFGDGQVSGLQHLKEETFYRAFKGQDLWYNFRERT